MNDFFDETTSNYSEQQESVDNNNQKNQSENKKKDSSVKKIMKPTKSYNSYNITQEFLYHPDLEQLDLQNYISQNIVIYVERKFFSRRNKNILKNKIYGSDFYTSSSDIVCIFLHYWMNLEEIKKKKFEVIGIVFTVSKIKKNYTALERNGIRSKRYTNQNSTKSLNIQNLKPAAYKTFQKLKFEKYYKLAQNLKLASKRVPYDVSKRIPKDNQLQFGQMVFNSNQELAFKYDIMNICDKSQKSKDHLSYLTTQYYLVLETENNQKYFLSVSKKENLKILGKEFYYKICKVKEPQKFDNSFFSSDNINFENVLEILYDELLWTDIQWGNKKITFKDMSIQNIANFKFYSNKDAKETIQLIYNIDMHNIFFSNETLLKNQKFNQHRQNQRELERKRQESNHQIIYHFDNSINYKNKIEYILILISLFLQCIISYLCSSHLSQINFFLNFFLCTNYLIFFGVQKQTNNNQNNLKLVLILCNYLVVFCMIVRTTIFFLWKKNNRKIQFFQICIQSTIALLVTIVIHKKMKKYSKKQPIEKIPLMTLFRLKLCILEDNIINLQYFINFVCIFSSIVIYFNKHLIILDIFMFFSCTLLIFQMIFTSFQRLIQLLIKQNPVEIDVKRVKREFLFISNTTKILQFNLWLHSESNVVCNLVILTNEDKCYTNQQIKQIEKIRDKYNIQNFSYAIINKEKLLKEQFTFLINSIFQKKWLQIYIASLKQFLKLFSIQSLCIREYTQHIFYIIFVYIFDQIICYQRFQQSIKIYLLFLFITYRCKQIINCLLYLIINCPLCY